MKIIDVICSSGATGFYFDDQRAIKQGAKLDGTAYFGNPVTEGFSAVRQKGESISVLLILEDGSIAHGDCAAVQYSGAGGRDPLFLAEEFIPVIYEEIAPLLIGRSVEEFLPLAKQVDSHTDKDGKKLHTAIRYGVSQALLDAVAKANKMQMCEVIAKEYDVEVSKERIPIFTQSGDNRHENADKMILKRADVLPHALINNVDTKLGKEGEILLEYVSWLSQRIQMLAEDSCYQPILHIDVYGTLGLIFGNTNYKDMVVYLKKLEEAAKPFLLRIEGPMDVENREQQMEALRDLRLQLEEQHSTVQLVADEWCNTLDDIQFFADNKAGHMIQIKTPDLGSVHNSVEAVLYCKEKGLGAYLGGTCNETDRSSQVCVHVAMGTKPDQILAKPGMGVDEGFMIVNNEMQRILALQQAKERQA